MSIRLPDKELLVKLHLEGELVSCTYLIFSNEGQGCQTMAMIFLAKNGSI